MPAVLLAAALAVLYVLLDPPSADLAAQVYRVGLFEREGLALYDSAWYGGHHLPAYSVLLPPLGAVLGLEALAAACIVGGTWAGLALTRSPAAAGWLAVALAATAVSGRLAFLLGTALGIVALLAAQRERGGLSTLAGLASALASPVAGLFAGLVGAALWVEQRRRSQAATVAAAAAGVLGLVVLFGDGGTHVLPAASFWFALAATAAAALASRRPALRAGAAMYALVLVAAYVTENPLGGNATRLGAVAGGPLAVLLLRRRPALLALAVAPLAYWTLFAAVRDWTRYAGDPTIPRAYHAALVERLRSEPGPPGRLEIPFTLGHWEAAHVAPEVPLARGWERQLDRKVNALFYEGDLTAERYREWLVDNAVRWVALPDAPLDHSAQQEAALIRSGLPYLDEIWRDEHWRLYAVRDPGPLGATALGTDWFTTTGGVVKVRWTPYWTVVEGRGCVRRAPGDWTLVDADPPGSTVRVAVRFEPLGALSGGPRCR